jgi:hypothetical protein
MHNQSVARLMCGLLALVTRPAYLNQPDTEGGRLMVRHRYFHDQVSIEK